MQNKFGTSDEYSQNFEDRKNDRKDVIHLIKAMLASAKKQRISREEVAYRMSKILGKEISKGMIDSYVANSRLDHNIAFYLIPAFSIACKSNLAISWLCASMNGLALFDDEKLFYELGKEQLQLEQTQERLANIKSKISGGAS